MAATTRRQVLERLLAGFVACCAKSVVSAAASDRSGEAIVAFDQQQPRRSRHDNKRHLGGFKVTLSAVPDRIGPP